MKISQYHIYEFTFSKKQKDDLLYAVVLSPNEMNDVLKTVIVAPLCNQCAITPTTFLIDNKTRIRLDQLTTFSKNDITKYIDKVDNSQIQKIKNTLDEMLIK